MAGSGAPGARGMLKASLRGELWAAALVPPPTPTTNTTPHTHTHCVVAVMNSQVRLLKCVLGEVSEGFGGGGHWLPHVKSLYKHVTRCVATSPEGPPGLAPTLRPLTGVPAGVCVPLPPIGARWGQVRRVDTAADRQFCWMFPDPAWCSVGDPGDVQHPHLYSFCFPTRCPPDCIASSTMNMGLLSTRTPPSHQPLRECAVTPLSCPVPLMNS